VPRKKKKKKKKIKKKKKHLLELGGDKKKKNQQIYIFGLISQKFRWSFFTKCPTLILTNVGRVSSLQY
jgi:hypothetical protein